MSRARKRSKEWSVTKAMQQFCEHGYHATSVQDLVECIGVGRGSIYSSFDSKRGLFLRALSHYCSIVKQRLAELLERTSSPVDSVMKIFANVIVQTPPRHGCFVVNSAVGMAPFDPEVARLVAQTFHEFEQVFVRLIPRGQATGQISSAVDAAATARCLLSLYIALSVLTRSSSDEALSQQIRHQAAVLLGCQAAE